MTDRPSLWRATWARIREVLSDPAPAPLFPLTEVSATVTALPPLPCGCPDTPGHYQGICSGRCLGPLTPFQAQAQIARTITDAEGLSLLQNPDGLKWSEAFCRVTGFADQDWALVWFANAIMTGLDTANRNARKVETDLLEKLHRAEERLAATQRLYETELNARLLAESNLERRNTDLAALRRVLAEVRRQAADLGGILGARS